jgi:hypothetical protein
MTNKEIENKIDKWHNSGDEETRPIYEYLGMTKEQYALWVENIKE